MTSKGVTYRAESSKPTKVSILSPRLLSLFPESSSGNRLLSPTFFSFQKNGYLSLPELFDVSIIISSDQKQQQFLLDIVLDVSGASVVLKNLIAKMKPEMIDMRYVKLPLIEELFRKDEKWIQMRNSFTEEQTANYNQKGYAFLNEDQLNLIYTKQDQLLSGINTTKLGMMSKEEKMKRLESDIRHLAALGRPVWPMWENARSIRKRQASSSTSSPPKHNGNGEHEEARINGVLYETLHPFAFTPMVAKGAALEAVTLSPHAFIPEIIRPQALVLETLSPRAFIAAILSPSALVARIISPTALRAEVLSPRALHTWILSPEAFIAEVLSPQFIDPRVLSPEALIIDVLSPDFLSPRIVSPEAAGIIILSPNILSPRVASEEKLLVEVLSPHILGGSHTREEASREVVQIGSRSDEGESNELQPAGQSIIH
ncbi:unnamed protein product [Angiostrongylus costaricensis]|uniref:ACT domain-containing protein n=1 Tax=Angiostrongylus costaricensis TaxID=334426 RepID=A0A0R3PEA6_ANGCS|nr:unnamed protein product [Angiostrongylus costaricensis]